MNTSPEAKTILCYGDSNTNGTMPNRKGRFSVNERWTGILQKKLGDGYYIIEEGLGGRTTDLDHYDDVGKPSRNGIIYFKACVDSHMPLDYLIIMIGTNDLKTVYNRSAKAVANALKQYIEYIKDYCSAKKMNPPKIILTSPAHMNDKASKFIEHMPSPGIYDEVSTKKSRELAPHIEQVAVEYGCTFFDAASVTHTGEDGCHLDRESHQKLAASFENIIKGL